MPKLTKLDFVKSQEYQSFKKNAIPTASLRNITHLRVEQAKNIEDRLEMLRKCTSLQYLNIAIIIPSYATQEEVIEICKTVPSLKFFKVRELYRPNVKFYSLVEHCRDKFKVSLAVRNHFIPMTNSPFQYEDISLDNNAKINGNKESYGYDSYPHCYCRTGSKVGIDAKASFYLEFRLPKGLPDGLKD